MMIKDHVEQICKEYFKTYLGNRDFEGLLHFLSLELKGFGSGADEFAKESEALLRLYQRDIKQAPNEIHYVFKEFEVDVLNNLTVVVFCIMDFETELLGQLARIEGLRFSLVFSREKECDGFLIRHKHVSFPAKEHEGDESYPLKEMEERNRILNRLVEEKTLELERILEETKILAITDKLTGLYNRLETDKRLEEAMGLYKRHGTPFSVLLIDVDHFKRVNDKYGHQKGDLCLKKTGSLLKKRIRNIDVLGRWGGEEFMVICSNTLLSDAVCLGESIRVLIEEESFDIDENYTVSIGVSTVSEMEEVNTVIKRADENLYKAKRNGRNRVEPVFRI